MIYSKTVLLKNTEYVRNNLLLDRGYNCDFTFNYKRDECLATFTCSDDMIDPRDRKTKEDLELFIIRKFGACISKENMYRPKDFDLSQKKINTPITNPILESMEKPDSYKDQYSVLLTKSQLSNANASLIAMSNELKFLKDKRIESEPRGDKHLLRIGQWHV